MGRSRFGGVTALPCMMAREGLPGASRLAPRAFGVKHRTGGTRRFVDWLHALQYQHTAYRTLYYTFRQ
jgi:hypothetical protein